MAYRKFYIIVIVRVILILATCFWFSEALRTPGNIYTLAVSGGLIIIQTISLIWSINRVNRSMAAFFNGIQELGSSVRPNFKVSDASFRELSGAIGRVAGIINDARLESERQLQYFRFLLDYSPSGILIAASDETVREFNNSAKTILGIKDLKRINDLALAFPAMKNEIKKFKPGYSVTKRLLINNSPEQISFKAAGFRSGGGEMLIVTIQNLTLEMEENELVSWQKLTRVLTHEIMNSLTPVSSLTEAARKCLQAPEIKTIKDEDICNYIGDAVYNLNLIEEKNEAIKNFVKSYKRISQVPAINTKPVNINNLVQKNIASFSSEFAKNKISISHDFGECPDSELDEMLVSQVLVNLIRNAIEAMNEVKEKKLELATYFTDGRIVVDITDSGKGIAEEEIEEIFTPFFTTREEGMGIGLSLSRQIMRLHRGSIKVSSTPGRGSTFSLFF